MFETAELGRRLTKDQYAQASQALRVELLGLQQRLVERRDFAVVVVVGGVEGAGKGELVNRLFEWMDARQLETHAFATPTDEERQRPPYWRFWMALPPKGKIGVFFGSWYSEPILKRVLDGGSDARLDAALTRANDFERALTDDGTLIVKLWLHISKADQKRRLKALAKKKSTRWRVSAEDWRRHAHYDDFRRVSERALRLTSTGHAPWSVIEASDARHRDIEAARTLAERLQRRLDAPTVEAPIRAEPIDVPDPHTVLDHLDLSARVSREEYEPRLELLQARLARTTRKLAREQRSLTLVFEGWDAAGKGGAIRRLTQAMDARQYRVISIAAPSDEERAHHYLWRFWRHLPRGGQVTIYDRSWYGRVLVERIEGFASRPAWMRAYKEINDFEEQLCDHGGIVLKFWLHISRDEQLRRFEEREKTAWKRHKIGYEDYRNREKWSAYEAAANEMIERTSTEFAPWVLISAEDKRHARLRVLEECCRRIRSALGAK